MLYNKDGFSKLGLGFMRHCNNSNILTEYAIKNNVNYFEACQFYLNGNCESIVQEALKNYPRNSYFLCDKLPVASVNYNNSIEDFFNQQLMACGVDYFDVYLFQALDRTTFNLLNTFNLIDFFDKQKQEGKIKYLGFSFHDTSDVLQKILNMYDWDYVQIQLNYYDWFLGDGEAIYKMLQKYKKPIIVMEPCKGGLLTNKLPLEIQNNIKIKYPKINFAELCYTFLKQLPNVEIILTGAERIEFLEQNLSFVNSSNTNYSLEEQFEIMKTILQQLISYDNFIQCTGCNYCVDKCPAGINIPQNFLMYNNLISNYYDKSRQKDFYDIIKSRQSFLLCRHCHNCEHFCPQHLPIEKLFSDKLWKMKL